MRQSHYLYKTRRAPLPRHIFYVDAESAERPFLTDKPENTKSQSVTVESVFTMGFAAFTRRRIGANSWDSTEWLKFTDQREFWQWLTTKILPKTKAYLFAHNVGFDIPVLRGFDYLPEFGFTLTNFIVDDPPTVLEFDSCPDNCGMRSGRVSRTVSKCEKSHRKLVIIDTLNYFRMSLKALGKAIGTYKLEIPRTPTGAIAPITPENQAQWDEYNKQDVQVLIDAVREYLIFITEHKLGAFAITQASQSFAAFRHRFMSHKILIDDNEDALRISRSAYYGGRVECFLVGERIGAPTYKVDINSMYPYVMHEYEYPTQLATVWRNVETDEYLRLREKYLFTAECVIETDEPVYPLRRNGKLIFPIGRFSCFLSTPEIDYAIAHGHLQKIKQMAVYHHDPIFAEFVDYFYTLRLAAKAANDERQSFFLKIMMNSLYGKFGQNGRKWKTQDDLADENAIRVWAEIDADSDEVTRFRQIGRIIQLLEGNAESTNSHPAIAAHITANARMYLWQLIVKAGLDADNRRNVFYCDTDSLFVNENGLYRLQSVVDNTRLGALKIEDVSDRLIIHGLKDYQFGDKTVLKGVRDAAHPVSPGVFRFESFRGLRGALHDGDLSRMVITRGLKRLRRVYDKGAVLPDGTVEPFTLTGEPG